ncbi:NAD-dependent protein deacetylase, SIR2 family [Agrilactobacillus composti DSM 18527 = JCM 14202]|uniref:protein acetyllysine N-acetyltransferase n=1 Tax=Agrilactobacillus composti DSM 18527 = JCM 14202 TaxID=1423734 RepID=X0PQM8_9LACO|nr:NAD-dependent protein deacylase [Agrilactobacillus composti]KRM31570.1 NAD-dependent protein deacetylase, SIR2 family [Agrilactobacillus composti DSM 18527 = JCM 14202]GAF39406.1 NAD-dependent protein deacetylase of SIR2 family [Agrilactobacillus composti DSM 18527 = JCM 14202]
MFDLKKAIEQAKHVTFLTGAGVSTPSGIPDYRSKGGLYAGHQNPEYLLSHENLIQHPDSFYDFVKNNMYFPNAKPNIIHEKMAVISNEKGSIVTQNVDGLHTKAGAKHVVEFHGNLYDIYCQTCGKHVDYKTYLTDYHHQEDGGILRPNIVLYQEGIPEKNLEGAVQAIEAADLIVVVGTSFKVYPFAALINYRSRNAKLVAVNKEKLDFDMPVEMIQGDAQDVFARL